VKYPPVGVIDYGAGNIASIVGALESVGADVARISKPEHVMDFESVVIPGVGSFGSAMRRLRASGMIPPLIEAVASGRYILGICLGMQLLFADSDEDGGQLGLGVLSGSVSRFTPEPSESLPVPHIGFNNVTAPEESILFQGITPGADFYFAHSHRVPLSERSQPLLLSTANYGGPFVASLEYKSTVFGVQFHPELSQTNGRRLLWNFVTASC